MSLLPLLAAACISTAPQDRTAQVWQFAEQRAQRQLDIWFKNGDFPRCVQLLNFRAKLFPSNYVISTDYGWMLENIDEAPRALQEYVRFRKQNPADPDGAYPEANYYFMRKQYDRVPPLLEPTLAKRPHPNSYRLLAHSYERLGKLSESARTWRALLARTPDDGAAKNNLSRVEKLLGQPSGGKR